jgi:hypothetical protein
MLHRLKHIILTILGIIVIFYIASWLFSFKKFDVDYGISFNQNHASSLGLDWRETYKAMLVDLQPKHLRIAAMWSEVEKVKYEYDFADVDFMMDEAEKAGSKVILVIGQKAPRWPECHVPGWVGSYTSGEAADHLRIYVRAAVRRYKNHPALEIWQVENEAFIPFEFGDCHGFRKELIYDEINIVRDLDPDRKIIITDSGELSTWADAGKLGDLFGTTMYRIVRTPSGGIFTYDWLPAGFYRLKSFFMTKRGYEEFFVSELQAEPWFTDAGAENTPVEEQEKTMNPERLEKHMDYAEHVGASRVYLWGVEWWYWMKEKNSDARYWELIKNRI